MTGEFVQGYKTALRDIVLVGCVCHDQGPEERYKCPVCEAVEKLKERMNIKDWNPLAGVQK